MTWPLIGPRPRKPPHSPRVYDMRCCSFQTHVMVQSRNCREAKPAINVLMGGCGGRFPHICWKSPPPFFFRGVENLTVQRCLHTTRMGICNTPHFWLANQLAIVFLGNVTHQDHSHERQRRRDCPAVKAYVAGGTSKPGVWKEHCTRRSGAGPRARTVDVPPFLG